MMEQKLFRGRRPTSFYDYFEESPEIAVKCLEGFIVLRFGIKFDVEGYLFRRMIYWEQRDVEADASLALGLFTKIIREEDGSNLTYKVTKFYNTFNEEVNLMYQLSSQHHESSRSRSPASSRSSTVRNGTSGHHSSSRSKNYSSSKDVTKIVQVANIAPQATREQMSTLFGYVGKIDDIRLYPTVDIGMQLQSKICFVKFYDALSVGSAQHLTNTVFIDRALIVIPYLDGDIPDETRALELLTSGSLLPGIADPKLPQHVTSQLEGLPPLQVVITKDPKLTERNLPPYPPLPPTVDSRKIEEIRRTIMVCNIPAELMAQEVMDYFSKAGEVKYFRFCTRDNDPLRYALIEFSEQPSILEALQFNGQYLGNKIIRVYHSTQAIIKPQAKTNEAAQKEIEEAMSRQAQNMLTHGLETSVAAPAKEKRRSRTRSRSHGRRSRSRGRRRSRSRSRRRSRSRSRRSSSRHRDRYRKSKKSRSRSRDRKRSRSRKRSTSRRRSKRSRSRSYSKRSRSRSRKREEKKKSKKDKDRDKDRDRDRHKDKDHRENGDDSDGPREKKKSDRRSRSPKSESKKRRRSRSRSHSRKTRSPSSHEKKRSKSKKKKKNDHSDREASVDSLGHSRGSSLEKRSKKESSGDLDYDDRSDGNDIDDERLLS